MIINFISTILFIIVGFFILHFIGLWISNKIRNIDKGWGINICKHIEFSITSDPSLMVSFYHYYKWYYEEEMPDRNMYSHNIVITFGGFITRIKYGHTPIEGEDDYDNDFCKSVYYGLHSIDGEKLWRDIWIGPHIYENPFVCSHFMGCFILDYNSGKLINKYATKLYDGDLDIPYFRIDENTTYVNKKNVAQHVPMIKWYICERTWCPPILNWLKLSSLYNHKVVDLEFECSNNGDKSFNGIGDITNEWKGGVYGSSVVLNDYPDILSLYKQIASGHLNNLSQFKTEVNNVIDNFMTITKKY